MVRPRRWNVCVVLLAAHWIACSEHPSEPPSGGHWPQCPGMIRTDVPSDVVWDISPDNQQVLYVHIEPGEVTGTLFIRDIAPESTADSLMPAAILDPHDLRFSPDGRRVALVRWGTYDVYVLDLDTGELRRVTFTSGNASDPDWDPSGQFILYQRPLQPAGAPDTASGFHIVDTATLESRPLRQANGSWIGGGEPRWSPDGHWITFWFGVRFDPGPTPRTATHILRMAVDGSRLRDLTPGPRNNEKPFWINGGDDILFISYHATTYNEHSYRVVDFRGERIREWPVDLNPYGTKLVISRDGTLFAVTGPDPECKQWVTYLQETTDLDGSTRIMLVHDQTGPR